MRTEFCYIPLEDYSRESLSEILRNDSNVTRYLSKDQLIEKIRDSQVDGYVVLDVTEGIVKIAGFVLDNNQQILDMYAFIEGRGRNLYQKMIGFYKETLKWPEITIVYDDNNEKMKLLFDLAVLTPILN